MKEETESDFDRHENGYPRPPSHGFGDPKNVISKNILVEKEGHGGGVIKM